ncbi:MAG: HEAT repeat domain-containing protein [Kiritimatiellae bacterium]|nr:HEAT repeat domain-containing protein [Kiritimatiellia bacterium]
MSRTKIVVAMTAMLAGCVMGLTAGEPLRVGLYKDNRSGEIDGVRKTLESEGFAVDVIDQKSIHDPASLAPLKVIYLPGGWSRGVPFTDFLGRKNLVDFVAQGKGILAGGYRSGWFRASNRPLFAQVGYTYMRNGGIFLFPRGDGPLVKEFDQPYVVENNDQVWVRTGPLGKVFAVNAGGEPIGIHGEVFGGRYAILGCFTTASGYAPSLMAWRNAQIAREKVLAAKAGLPPPKAPAADDTAAKPELQGMARQVFLNCIRWLADTPAAPSTDIERNRAAAELDFLKREAQLDWMVDGKGPDNASGVLPQIRDELESRLLARLWRLEFAAANLEATDKAQADEAVKRLRVDIAKLQERYAQEVKRKEQEISGLDRAGLAADNPILAKDAILARIAKTPGKSDAERNALTKALNAKVVTDANQREVLKFLYGDKLQAALFPAKELNTELALADKALAELAPLVAPLRAMAEKREIEQDLTTVPELIKQCASDNVRTRSDAVWELGRLGDKRAVPALLARLDDTDLQSRVRAIQALGWLQAAEAVPALLKIMSSDNLRLRRRAAQALGQIGDARAVQPLLAAMNDPDYHMRQNAILALGWLGSKEAVPALLKLAGTSDREDAYQHELMCCAIRSLGHIGDERAAPVLEKWIKEAEDAPPMRYIAGQPRRANIYACNVGLGLQGFSELALAEIKQGGRKQAGLKQPEYLRLRDRFHGLQKNFNFLAGRAMDNVTERWSKDDLDSLFACIWSAGGTGVHCAWASGRGEYQPAVYKDMLRNAGAYGLKWIDAMPISGCAGPWSETMKDNKKWFRANGYLLAKPSAEMVLMAYADAPAFQGFWSEENWPEISTNDPQVQKGFAGYVAEKHGADFRSKLGLAADAAVLPPPEEQKAKQPLLWADFMEYAGGKIVDEWREGQEWLQGMRKGAAFTWSESEATEYRYIGLCGPIAGAVDGFGPESYVSFAPNSTLRMELAKDGEPRAVMCEFYNWYDPSPNHTRLGMSAQLMHGECFFNFNFIQIAPKSMGSQWDWAKTNWDIATDVFTRARSLKDYLAGVSSAANVALVASERTQILLYTGKIGESIAGKFLFRRRYQEQFLANWALLRQAGVQADAIWAETMTPEKLAHYKVLLLPDAKSLTSEQTELLRSWVKAGGVLIATGTTSLFDANGLPLKEYALADVFGVAYQGHGAEASPEASDTWCYVPGNEPPLTVQAEGLDPALFMRYVHREMKPTSSIVTCKVARAGADLPGLAEGAAMEYDLPLGYDKVAPKTANVLAKMPSGDPALTVNRLGKGLCYFTTAAYPALGYTQGETIYTPQVFNFWPGVVETFSAMIRGGLQAQGAALPAEVVAGAKADIEVTVRKHPEKDLWIVHLLDWNTGIEKTSGVKLAAHPPEGRKISKVFYPDNGKPIEFTATAVGIEFPVRDFATHEMIAVEY